MNKITKICIKCKQEKSSEEYYNDKYSRDGKEHRCKLCRNIYRRESYLKNKERENELAKIWKENNKEKCIKDSILYRESHKESENKRVIDWREKNKEHWLHYLSDYNKVYFKTPRGKMARSKADAKRGRNLGWIQLFENPFPDDVIINWHHVNDLIVVPIPKSIHKMYNSSIREDHRNNCNKWLMDFYGIDFNV